MLATITKRLLQGLIVIIAITVITFVMLRLIPSDPSRTMAPNATEAQLLQLKEQMGIGDPIAVQFAKYVNNLFSGYLGYSYFQKADVVTVIGRALPVTGILLMFAIIISLVFGLILGIIAAIYSNTWIDRLISGFSVLFQSMPNYWVGIILIQIVSVNLKLLPSTGYKNIRYAILPSIVLSLPMTAVLIRNIRASMMDSINQSFVKAAKARGIPSWSLLVRYSFRNSLIPVLTIFGTQLGILLGNSVVVEYVFGYPGIGMQILNAILRRDYYLVQGLVALLSGVFILINMAIDISYIYLDPRIRKAQGGL
ncbi:MAG TPA: ABC transporter permease [Clostridia bacterium]|nr:ABC transporter permease [Clostridia bacterium]